MYKHIFVLVFSLILSFDSQAGWLEQVTAVHKEIEALTHNSEALGDEQRLERYYVLSYDLAMLESPRFATSMGDPRGQDRLDDISMAGIERRQKADRNALAFVKASIGRAFWQLSK
jgi:hypothetical protein